LLRQSRLALDGERDVLVGQRFQSAGDLRDALVPFAGAFGRRQLAEWMRGEFRAEVEGERERLRRWLSEGDDAPTANAPRRRPIIAPELLVTPEDAFPTLRTEGSEAPSAAFDVSEERTQAIRVRRTSALARPERPSETRAPRRIFVWAIPPALAVAAGVMLSLAGTFRDARPGKVVVTASPAVDAVLLIDGRSAGHIPPHVRSVSPGKHRIEVRAEGYRPFVAHVTVRPGDATSVDASLLAEKPPGDVAPPDVTTSSPVPGR